MKTAFIYARVSTADKEQDPRPQFGRDATLLPFSGLGGHGVSGQTIDPEKAPRV